MIGESEMKAKLFFQLMLLAVLWSGCATKQDFALERNKELVRRYFEGWANHGDTTVADKLISKSVTLHSPPAVLHSLEEYKASMAKFHAGFPDLSFTIEDLVAERDRIVVRWTLRATQSAEYQGHLASGKAFTVTGISLFQIADGEIQEIHVYMDWHGMMEQLGCYQQRLSRQSDVPLRGSSCRIRTSRKPPTNWVLQFPVTLRVKPVWKG